MLNPRQAVLKRRYGMSISDRYTSGIVRARAARYKSLAMVRVPATPPAIRSYPPMQRTSGRFQGGSAREVKCFDCTPAAPGGAGINWVLGAVAAAEPGAVFTGMTCINEIQQGATVYNRVGSKILMKSIRLRMMLFPALGTAMNFMRVAIVYDRQPNGAYPTIGDIFAEDVTGTTTHTAPLNIANVRRFTPLRDQMITVDPAKALVNSIDWYITCRMQTEYKGSTNTIGDITTGSLLLIISSYNPVSVSSFPAGGVSVRIRYDDS